MLFDHFEFTLRKGTLSRTDDLGYVGQIHYYRCHFQYMGVYRII